MKSPHDSKDSKPIKRLTRLLTSENLWLYLLSLIRKNKKLYAYELDKQIEKRFNFKPNKVMVYVVLYRIENEGLISSEFEERRKYYKLTKKGNETLELARKHFKMLSDKL
ncbi:PadR family transcriptional regulator [Candidatus Micrarchaeota archaeon]|nr:PadR family transcriptional regulator [Candidatus Micrarchaeota archaeon]MBU1165550.1 PadR family transcriptional regulator [Candidatus Micrarchaeota archaeon]MBU1886507.1 PadR family transcriptional regulator [Candidatus Micrarchaeota archaeon]